MVDWLEKQSYCGTREKAVSICIELQKQDALVHVWGSKKFTFTDATMFFRFSKEDDPSIADVYDMVVIGGGTAGISATGFAGQFGANVVMIEANRVGGDCTWSGCVPSKSLIVASHSAHGAKAAQNFGISTSQPLADMKKVKEYVWSKIHTIAEEDLKMLQDRNVPLRYGMAKFIDPNTLELKSREGEVQKIKSRAFVLCLGAVPATPPIKGIDTVPYYTYETIFDVDWLPKRMCVVGGGVIGCEIAQSFARLGSDVTIIANQFLPKEPKKVDEILSKQFEEDGMKILRGRGESVEKVDDSGSVLKLTVKSKTETQVVECELLLVAIGRRPNTSEMNLEAAGVQLDEKTKLIKVTPQLQTTASHIYAAGDCCTLQQFTHYASQMGVWAARNLLLPGSSIPTHIVPRATFTTPEIASVGLTETEAREKGHEVFSQPSTHNERAICEGDVQGFIDVYLDKKGHIVGACIMNNRAGELLAELLVAMERKIPFQDLSLSSVVHPYPTYTWATMMLATEVHGKQVEKSSAGSFIKWYVGRGSGSAMVGGASGPKDGDTSGTTLANRQMAVVTGNFGDVTLASVYQQLQNAATMKDRTWLGKTYKSCANASEMVDWLEKQSYCGTREKAVSICIELQKQDALVHVWGSKKFTFTDATMFFRFSKEDDPSIADVYDMVVIGGGTAGISATGFAGQFGANVVMIEANRVGGDCTWSGCVPSKSLIVASHSAHGAKAAQNFGISTSQPLADMKKVKEYVWSKIHTIAEEDLKMLQDRNVPLRYGMAKFIDPNTLELKSREGEVQKIKSRAFVLCLGAVPATPPIKGIDTVPYYTYETIFDVDWLPKRMCVVGGGVIGCEIAQSFARLGSDVTIIANQFLPKEPKKVDEILSKQFEEDGMKILRGRGESVEKVDDSGSVLKLTVKSKTETQVVECELLLVAIGRRPNTSEMNLEAAGVQLDEKTKLIKVTPQLQTTASHIYAAGDCCTLQQFTHYASQMGVWAARNLLLPGSSIPTHIVPRATFTTPEIASVGLTETEAREKGHEVFSQPSTHNERAICEGDVQGFIDVYLDKKGHIVGACIMNNRAGELLAELLVAMEKKIPFQDLSLSKVVHPYPTYTWATMMLATEVHGKQLEKSSAGNFIKWYVGRGSGARLAAAGPKVGPAG